MPLIGFCLNIKFDQFHKVFKFRIVIEKTSPTNSSPRQNKNEMSTYLTCSSPWSPILRGCILDTGSGLPCCTWTLFSSRDPRKSKSCSGDMNTDPGDCTTYLSDKMLILMCISLLHFFPDFFLNLDSRDHTWSITFSTSITSNQSEVIKIMPLKLSLINTSWQHGYR